MTIAKKLFSCCFLELHFLLPYVSGETGARFWVEIPKFPFEILRSHGGRIAVLSRGAP